MATPTTMPAMGPPLRPLLRLLLPPLLPPLLDGLGCDDGMSDPEVVIVVVALLDVAVAVVMQL